MLFDKRLASGGELSPDVCEGAVGSEMTRVGGGIPGIPSSNLFLNDFSNGGFVRRCLGRKRRGRDRVPPLQTIIFSSFPGRTKGCRPSGSYRVVARMEMSSPAASKGIPVHGQLSGAYLTLS
jgi:hypothetical protein